MNRNKLPLAGVVAAALASTMMVPCFADTSGASPPTVQIRAHSFKVVPDLLGRSNDRIELSAQVNASDLNLAHRRDLAKLQQRVQHAAEVVCTQIGERYPALVDPDDYGDAAACVQNAVHEANSQIKVAAVAAQLRAGGELSRSG